MMRGRIYPRLSIPCLIVFLVLTCSTAVRAQMTAFTYQGKLTDAGNPANANYDFQFALFDSLNDGSQIGSTLSRPNVSVSSGIFTVLLDFDVNAFPGTNRFLEIGVRPAGGGSFTTLAPRQQINSTPYAVHTISATTADSLSSVCIACVPDSQINSVAGSKVTGTIPVAAVPAGSANYVQNSTSQQAAANFNISGNGTASSVNVNGPVSLGAIASPGVAPAGQGRIYFDTSSNKVKVSENGTAFVNLVGASGVSGSGTTNSIPLWSAGTTLGNSLITQSGGLIQLPNNVALAPGLQGNNVAFGSPNSETGMTISGASGRADLRYDGTLKLVNGSGGIPLASNGIAIDSTGNVGIGTTSPNGKFEVNAGGSGGVIRFHTPNAESGMSIIGTNRADVRFDGQTLKLLAGLTTSSPCCGIAVNTQGNVGIGMFAPLTRLALSGGPQWTLALWAGSLSLQNASAIGWEANPSGQRFGIGQTTGGLFFFRTTNAFNTTISLPTYDMQITDTGNIIQPAASNGLVKAMLVLDEFSNIIRCYNGITNTSSGNCGFTVTLPLDGVNHIDFHFPISSRFVSVTAQYIDSVGQGLNNGGANYRFSDATSLDVFTFTSGNSADTSARPFTIIIY